MKMAIGSDHVGFDMKSGIIQYLSSQGIEVIDVGTNSSTRTDYPIYARKVAESIIAGEVELGILICGTGIGISIAANKMTGIRAVACSEPYSAKLSREHNNTNILAMGARVIGSEMAKMIIDQWLSARFEGGRHQERIDQISAIEHSQHMKG
ncbi:ribose 5-phosphate isomerase B [Prodigiosinella confusarubida]|uniref:Ribose 5-phosphate isomerase B n=1 Tax=Serratia sp. (strain ATCC 39006) TaxID=104623 RepID=A0A2I5TJ04_SERS3|nr:MULTISPECIES: ribose 5-phosphate isomerase B [Enterobacterales]AUH00234.1 ribose 5-phosphate isomerase B [Serratia sp. ATCC 39006]AUH04554.1 ribose 5-phosphate isomerase B [Serratia sp. ATCC 39006]